LARGIKFFPRSPLSVLFLLSSLLSEVYNFREILSREYFENCPKGIGVIMGEDIMRWVRVYEVRVWDFFPSLPLPLLPLLLNQVRT
jgi:hypothetical protein